MIKIYLLTIMVCLCSLTFSCKQPAQEQEFIIETGLKTIPLISDTTYVTDSKTIIDSISIIPLALEDGTILSGADKLVKHNGFYFLLDKKFTSLYRFNLHGKLLNKIGKLGPAKDQYTGLEDFIIDSLDRVVLLSHGNMGIFYYTQDNTFLKFQNIGVYGSSFGLLSKNRYFIYINYSFNNKAGTYNFIETDTTGKLLQKIKKYNRFASNMGISFSGFIASNNNQTLYSDAFNDTIYSVGREDTVVKKYWVDFGPHSLKNEKANHEKIVNNEFLMKQDIAFLGNTVCFNDKYLSFNYTYKHRNNFCIFQKNSERLILYNKDPKDALLKMLGAPLLIDKDNKFYFAVSPETVVFIRQSYPEIFKEMKKKWPSLYIFCSSLSLNNNYFLLTATLK